MRLADINGRILYAAAWLAGRLPLRVLHALATVCAWLSRSFNRREYLVTRRNLELIAPQAGAEEREQRSRAVLRETWRVTLESMRFWTCPSSQNLRQVRAVHGGEHFEAALAADRGLIIAAPHYGNWELLNQYLSSRTPILITYREPESGVGDAFLRLARVRPAVQTVHADPGGVRPLMRHLRGGGVVGFMPDQQPKIGEGAFAPFFGRPALTMTLLGRLAQRSGATVLFAYAERIDRGRCFDIHFEPAPAALADADPAISTAALNSAIESVARRDEEQYQWTYKRYTLRPPDSGEENPYWPDCYPNQRGAS